MANDLTIEQLQEIVDACAGMLPPDILLGNQHASIGDVARQCISLIRSEEKLRAALQYIKDHHWVAGATPVKWINEFVDVANKALTGEY